VNEALLGVPVPEFDPKAVADKSFRGDIATASADEVVSFIHKNDGAVRDYFKTQLAEKGYKELENALAALDAKAKDESGKYVKDPEQCRVRVSLGLNPTFDKVIGWHPKDTTNARNIGSIVADADGIYVLECLGYGASQLRKYDHDGKYVQTLVPWDPDKLDQISIPKRTLPDAKIWQDGRPPADRTACHRGCRS
jgi:hypothetical protein